MPTLVLPEIPPELIARYDVPGPRYTSYPTVPTWSDRVGPADLVQALERASAHPARPLSLYVHLPFCRRLCTYCGCNVIVTREPTEVDRYLDALDQELGLLAAPLGERRTLSQIHWGGGTPTFLTEAQLERLWTSIAGRFTVAPGAEVAIEIDPRVTTRAQLARLRQLGFNRLSMGVQDLAPGVQEAIGRHQTLAETRDAIEGARALGFAAVNVDLVYGLPGQTAASWAETLAALVTLAPDRLALYSFAFVPDARPHQRRLPVADLPSGARKLDLYRQAHQALTAAAYVPIGMDHFARPEDELARAQAEGRLHRNFQGYTAKAAEDVVAAGVTGIGDVAGLFAQNVRTLPRYHAALAAGRLPTTRGLWLTEDDLRRRALINQLMCAFEVDLGADGTGWAEERAALEPLAADGLVELAGTKLRVTPVGRLFVRNVAMVFDAHLRTAPSTARMSRTV